MKRAWRDPTGVIHLQPTDDGLPEGCVDLGEGYEDGQIWDDTLEQWVAPPPPRIWEMRYFLTTLLIPVEVVLIRTWQPITLPASPADLTFIWAREVILTLSEVNLDDPNTSTMLDMCVERGLLTTQRAERILQGLEPEI